jgi:hypothetical protein
MSTTHTREEAMNAYEERKSADFKYFRTKVLHITQKQMATLLGYSHKIRISEYERQTNPVPVPAHIHRALMEMFIDWFAYDVPIEKVVARHAPPVRQWVRHHEKPAAITIKSILAGLREQDR